MKWEIFWFTSCVLMFGILFSSIKSMSIVPRDKYIGNVQSYSDGYANGLLGYKRSVRGVDNSDTQITIISTAILEDLKHLIQLYSEQNQNNHQLPTGYPSNSVSVPQNGEDGTRSLSRAQEDPILNFPSEVIQYASDNSDFSRPISGNSAAFSMISGIADSGTINTGHVGTGHLNTGKIDLKDNGGFDNVSSTNVKVSETYVVPVEEASNDEGEEDGGGYGNGSDEEWAAYE